MLPFSRANPVIGEVQPALEIDLGHVAVDAVGSRRRFRAERAERLAALFFFVTGEANAVVLAVIGGGFFVRIVAGRAIEPVPRTRPLLLEARAQRKTDRGKSGDPFAAGRQFVRQKLIGAAVTFPAAVDGLPR